MDSTAIRQELRARGYSYKAIADCLDYTCEYVSMVACRKRTSHRVAAAIAAAVGRPASEVFPDIKAYHPPYVSQSDRNRELARRLEQHGLVQRCA